MHDFIRDAHYKKLTAKEKISLLHDASVGLQTIHSKNVIHGDIKSHNLLVHRDERGKYSCSWGDLGGAIFLKFKGEKVKVEQGTSGWTAPEVFMGDGYSQAVDIFSFAMVMCDASVPGGFNNQLIGLDSARYVEAVRRGLLPHLNRDGSGVAELVEYCWNFLAKNRPNIGQVEERLLEELKLMQ